MRLEIFNARAFEIGMHVPHGCRDARMARHCLHDAIARASIDGVSYKGVAVLMRRDARPMIRSLISVNNCQTRCLVRSLPRFPINITPSSGSFERCGRARFRYT